MFITSLILTLLVSLGREADTTDEGLCSLDQKSCSQSESVDENQDEFSFQIRRQIDKAMAGYKPCSSDAEDASCTCHTAVLNRDLASYKSTGVTRQMIESSAKYGTKYKVFMKIVVKKWSLHRS